MLVDSLRLQVSERNLMTTCFLRDLETALRSSDLLTASPKTCQCQDTLAATVRKNFDTDNMTLISPLQLIFEMNFFRNKVHPIKAMPVQNNDKLQLNLGLPLSQKYTKKYYNRGLAPKAENTTP